MSIQIISEVFPERSTRILQTTLTDKDDVAITAADLASLTMTLWVKDGDTIATDRDILNQNGGSLDDATGLLEVKVFPADNAIVDPDLDSEIHRGVIEAMLNNVDQDSEKKYFEFTVNNIPNVP